MAAIARVGWRVALGAIACLLGGAATAGAATVTAVDNALGSPTGERSVLTFDAVAGEANAVSLTLGGLSDGRVTYTVTDAAAPLSPGPGCTGGGPAGTPATCTMAASRALNCVRTICFDLGHPVNLELELGDGDDSLAAGSIPADDGGGGVLTITVGGGAGADSIITGAGPDTIDPGTGADSVDAGAQGDKVIGAGPTPDGPDRLDLGADGGELDYSAATAPVAVSLDGIANDGGPGEGDNAIGATAIKGGAADDELVGTDAREYLAAGPGKDTIDARGGDDTVDGGPGGDQIDAGSGDDLVEESGTGRDHVRGGPGDDLVESWEDADVLIGGPGVDDLFSGGGPDRVTGGSGSDDLNGGAGPDRIVGGSGADRLTAGRRDHDPDALDCGTGLDQARLAPEDRERRCEQTAPSAA